MINLYRLCFRNFRSYGNKWVDLKFSQGGGLNIIYGDNAAGKTSIKYAVDYVLFGKIRGLLTDVVNRINKRDCEAFLFLKILDRYVVIMRGHQPQYLGYVELKDESEIFTDKILDLKKRMVKCSQKDIDNFLNINSNLYTNCISVSINNFKSYINLSMEEKRKIIDNLFNIGKINELNDRYKKILKNILNDRQMIEKEIDQVNSEIMNFENMKNNFILEEDNIRNRENIERDLKNFKEKYNDITSNYLLKSENLYRNLNVDISNLLGEKAKVESQIRYLSGRLSVLSGERCPTCNSLLSTEDVLNLKNKIKNDIEKNKKRLKEIVSNVDELSSDIKKLYSMIKGFYHQKEELSLKIYEIENVLKSLDEKSGVFYKVDSEIKTRKEKLEKLNKKLSDISNVESFYKKILQILDDTGLKNYILSKVSVVLNKIIDNYRNQLNLKYKVIVEPDFSVSLYYMGDKIDYHILSTGEVRKIDLLMIISILYYLKLVYPDLNVVFFDEIFSSLDEDNISLMVSVLDNFARENQINFYLISPDYISYDKYNSILYVKKENGFSRIEEIH